MIARVLCGLLLLATGAHAQPASDPDEEIARRHFEEGRAFYDTRRYQEALTEFEAARRVRPVPAFDFNIARCHDRLEHFAQAVAEYQRYVDSDPRPKDSDLIVARIAVLKKRVVLAPLSPVSSAATPASNAGVLIAQTPPTKMLPKRRKLAVALSVSLTTAAVVALAIGLGAGLKSGPAASARGLGTVQATP